MYGDGATSGFTRWLQGVPEDPAAATKRRWESLPFLAATVVALWLGDPPSHLSGVVISLAAAAGALYAFIPLSGQRVLAMVAVFALMAFGVWFVAAPIDWHWAWLEEEGRVPQALAAGGVSVAVVLLAMSVDIVRLHRWLGTGRLARRWSRNVRWRRHPRNGASSTSRRTHSSPTKSNTTAAADSLEETDQRQPDDPARRDEPAQREQGSARKAFGWGVGAGAAVVMLGCAVALRRR